MSMLPTIGCRYRVTQPFSIISGSSNSSRTKSGVGDLARHPGGVERGEPLRGGAGRNAGSSDVERGLTRAVVDAENDRPARRGARRSTAATHSQPSAVS